MAQNNATVQFYYISTNDTPPATKDENTIYFDAKNKELYVGETLIASNNFLPDLSDYVTKENAEVIDSLTFNSNGSSGTIEYFSDRGFVLSDANDGVVKLTNLSYPTEDSDAATKYYVEEQLDEFSNSNNLVLKSDARVED